MDMKYEPRNNPERDFDAAIRDAHKNLKSFPGQGGKRTTTN